MKEQHFLTTEDSLLRKGVDDESSFILVSVKYDMQDVRVFTETIITNLFANHRHCGGRPSACVSAVTLPARLRWRTFVFSIPPCVHLVCLG